jgi:hypothetical protein
LSVLPLDAHLALSQAEARLDFARAARLDFARAAPGRFWV